MLDNIKMICLAILAIVVIVGGYSMVSNYVEAMGYAGQYETAQKTISERDAEIVRLKGLIAAGSDLGAEFTQERDGIYSYFHDLDEELWQDFRCSYTDASTRSELEVVTAGSTSPKPVPVRGGESKALNTAWKAYCSTVTVPTPGCEVTQ